MTIFLMFFTELMAARFDVFGHQAHGTEAAGSFANPVDQRDKYIDSNTQAQGRKL